MVHDVLHARTLFVLLLRGPTRGRKRLPSQNRKRDILFLSPEIADILRQTNIQVVVFC